MMDGQHPAVGLQTQGQLKVIDAADMGLTETQVAMVAALSSLLYLANNPEPILAERREKIHIATSVLLTLAPRREEIMHELAVQATVLDEILSKFCL